MEMSFFPVSALTIVDLPAMRCRVRFAFRGLYCSGPFISNFPSISNSTVSWRLNSSKRERTSSDNSLQSSSIFRSIPSSFTRRFQRALTFSLSMFSSMKRDTSPRKVLNISLTRRWIRSFIEPMYPSSHVSSSSNLLLKSRAVLARLFASSCKESSRCMSGIIVPSSNV